MQMTILYLKSYLIVYIGNLSHNIVFQFEKKSKDDEEKITFL